MDQRWSKVFLSYRSYIMEKIAKKSKVYVSMEECLGPHDCVSNVKD